MCNEMQTVRIVDCDLTFSVMQRKKNCIPLHSDVQRNLRAVEVMCNMGGGARIQSGQGHGTWFADLQRNLTHSCEKKSLEV